MLVLGLGQCWDNTRDVSTADEPKASEKRIGFAPRPVAKEQQKENQRPCVHLLQVHRRSRDGMAVLADSVVCHCIPWC